MVPSFSMATVKGDMFANDVKAPTAKTKVKPVIGKRSHARLQRAYPGSADCKAWRKLAYECELGMQEMDKGNFNTNTAAAAARQKGSANSPLA